MRVRTSYACHPGKKRSNNQDNLYYQGSILEQNHKYKHSLVSTKWDTGKLLCFGVFDGMGGEQHGELASYLAACVVKETLQEPANQKLPSDLLYDICRRANAKIYQKTMEMGAERIGTTAAIVMLQYDTIWCCNLGDSKIFRLRENSLEQLSMDHVAMEKTGIKAGLTAHLGMSPAELYPNPYLVNERILPGDTYLICSDGVTDMLAEETMQQLLTTHQVKKATDRFIKEVLQQGGLDNATLILLQVMDEM